MAQGGTSKEAVLSKQFSVKYNIKGDGGTAFGLQNFISTSKYPRWLFGFYFTIEQFSKLSNLLTLVVGIISCFPSIAITFVGGPLVPLSFILFLALIKELYEDRKRQQSDREINCRNIVVLENNYKSTIMWQELAVGNMVLIQKGDELPADLIILASSEQQGNCFVNTVELDGETNLKIRSAIAWTHSNYFKTPELIHELKFQCMVEEPNDKLYLFNGKLLIDSIGVLDVTQDNILLRGTSLQNTEWVYGVVIYTGYDCKIQKNLRSIPLKMSPSIKKVNLQTIFLLIGFIVMCIVHVTGSILFLKVPGNKALYSTSSQIFFLQFLKSLLLYHNIIPISLTVTLEFVKFFQSRFIESDPELMDKESGKKPKVICSDLIDCLGQINLILTDKTGTLTQNMMVLRKCIVDEQIFVDENEQDENYPRIKHLLRQYETNNSVQHFINNIMVCNSIIPERPGVFKSVSSEEICMIEYMHEIGLTFLSRSLNQTTMRFNRTRAVSSFDILLTIDFSSARKRMTVIVRDESGHIFVYTKGADSVVIPGCIPNSATETVLDSITVFSKEGLRSLCFAYREMSQEELVQLQNELALFKAGRHPVYSEAEGFYDYFYTQIESNMHLLGTIALEDALQEGVPETIEKLFTAGIRVWMLTGDKREVAIDVGILSGIIQEDFQIVQLDWKNADELMVKLVSLLSSMDDDKKYCAVVGGIDFDQIRANSELLSLFIKYVLKCTCVVLYRATPLHKSELAAVIKRQKLGWKLLAIGDGANDVSMIREAHVGIGLMGKEGLQASRSSDFAIFQFKDLQKLLFVHGLWAYHRFSKTILFIFYKNIVVYLTQFLFAFDNGFSGTSVFNKTDMVFFNLIYSAAPPMVLGLVEQFLPQSLLLSLPHLYKLGPTDRFLSLWSFWGAIFNGIYHSCFTYYWMRYMLRNDIILSPNVTGGREFFSGTLFFCQLMTICGKAALSTSTWNSLSLIGIAGTIAVYCVLAPLLDRKSGLFGQMYTSEFFWVASIAVPCGALLKDLVWKYMKHEYFPTSYHIALKKKSKTTDKIIYKHNDIEIRDDSEEQ